MNRNRLIKKILFIFVLIVIGILTPKNVKAITVETFSSTEEDFWIWEDDAWNKITHYDEEIEVLASCSYKYDGVIGQAFTYTSLETKWWWLCCAESEPLMGEELDLWSKQWAYFTYKETMVANPAEAYQLSTLDVDNPSGSFTSYSQFSWWATHIGQIGGEASSGYESYLVGSDFQTYIFEVMEWSSSYNNQDQDNDIYSIYGSDYKEYTIDGLSVQAPDLEEALEDKVKFSDDIDVDGDGLTREDEDPDDEIDISVNDDTESDPYYVIGPFMLEYPEYYGDTLVGGVKSGTTTTKGMTDEEIDEAIYKSWLALGSNKITYEAYYNMVRSRYSNSDRNI